MSSELKRANRRLWLFGLFKIPLIFFCRPRIESLDDEQITVSIPLNRRTRNHLSSMYFGALAIGADIAGGFLAFHLAEKSGKNISLAFKGFDAEFLSRPESSVYFTAQNGKQVLQMLAQSENTGERINEWTEIEASTRKDGVKTIVAQCRIQLSIKVKPMP